MEKYVSLDAEQHETVRESSIRNFILQHRNCCCSLVVGGEGGGGGLRGGVLHTRPTRKMTPVSSHESVKEVMKLYLEQN